MQLIIVDRNILNEKSEKVMQICIYKLIDDLSV